MKYMYSFQVWPDETKDWGKDGTKQPMFVLYSTMGRRELEFTEEEFERFRRTLLANWVTLREVERVPYHEHEPESVL